MCREAAKLAACHQAAKELGLDLRGVEVVEVRFGTSEFLSTREGNYRLQQMHLWCMRGDRPGFFCVTYPGSRNVHALFYFSNADVAFEFKMKWC